MKKPAESPRVAQQEHTADRLPGKTGFRVLTAGAALMAVVALLLIGIRYLGHDGSRESASFDSAYRKATSVADDSLAADPSPAYTTLKGNSTLELSRNALQSAQGSMPDGVDLASLTDSLADVFDTSSRALAGITDVDTARAAVSQIEAASARLDELEKVISQLPAVAHGPVDAVVSNGMTIIKPLIDKVSAVPGVAELVQPVLGPMLVNLLELTD